MYSKANEIHQQAKQEGETVVLKSMDYQYLIRMSEALEKINRANARVESGEMDGMDFAVTVGEILDRL